MCLDRDTSGEIVSDSTCTRMQHKTGRTDLAQIELWPLMNVLQHRLQFYYEIILSYIALCSPICK